MYSRVAIPPPKKIVRNGKIKFGTFFPVPQRMDIRGVIAPFAGLPMPSVITNFRIRSRIVYMFSVDKFIGFVEIFDGKIFALADVILWNRDTGKKYIYHTFMTARTSRYVPVHTGKGLFASYKRSHQVRLDWDREKNKILLSIKMKGDSVYPGISCYVHSTFDDACFQEFAMVSPAPVTSRCSATWIINSASNGALSISATKNQQGISVVDNSALSCFALNRLFYKFHTHLNATCGIGINEGKKIIFRFVNTSFDAVDSDSYNENFLTIDGKTTLMPPIVITHHFGVEKKWIIQDTENMVDLTFTPVSVSKHSLHLIFFYTMYNSVYGTFEGVVVNGDGEKIIIKDFPGIATSNMIRL